MHNRTYILLSLTYLISYVSMSLQQTVHSHLEIQWDAGLNKYPHDILKQQKKDKFLHLHY